MQYLAKLPVSFPFAPAVPLDEVFSTHTLSDIRSDCDRTVPCHTQKEQSQEWLQGVFQAGCPRGWILPWRRDVF
jgi:hypothetical protein